jgi:Protein of unknown function (DUF2849)
MLKVISANRLADGIVVYAGQGGTWFERINSARLFATNEEAEAGLALAQADAARNLIVDPCLVDVTQDAGGVHPATLREFIRARGPTIDFLAHQRAYASGAIPASKTSVAQAGKPAMRDAKPEILRSYGAKPRQAHSAADVAQGIAR